MHAEDAALVQRLLAGNAAAFEGLVRALHPRLLRVIRRLGVGVEGAEDVAQETWQRVLGALDRFEGRARLSTWIVQIAVNQARTQRVRTGREDALEEDDADPLAGRFTSMGRWVEAPRPWTGDDDPEAAVSRRQLRALVLDAMGKLPEPQRLVVQLRDIEGLDAIEVCAALSISEANQRVLLHRGRTRLRALVEDAMREP